MEFFAECSGGGVFSRFIAMVLHDLCEGVQEIGFGFFECLAFRENFGQFLELGGVTAFGRRFENGREFEFHPFQAHANTFW